MFLETFFCSIMHPFSKNSPILTKVRRLFNFFLQNSPFPCSVIFLDFFRLSKKQPYCRYFFHIIDWKEWDMAMLSRVEIEERMIAHYNLGGTDILYLYKFRNILLQVIQGKSRSKCRHFTNDEIYIQKYTDT